MTDVDIPRATLRAVRVALNVLSWYPEFRSMFS